MRGAGGVVIELGGGVIRIRILIYPACILQDTRILMYLDVSHILHALFYIPREYMYLDSLHVFHTYPKGVQDTFVIHISCIKIHVSYALP